MVMVAAEAVVTDHLARQKAEPPTPEKVDGVLKGLVDRGLRSIYLHHARQRGATEEWCKDLENAHVATVVQVVTIIYGDPPMPGEIKPEDISKLTDI